MEGFEPTHEVSNRYYVVFRMQQNNLNVNSPERAELSNMTGNDEVLFRASADKGKTFGDKINLSNTTGTDSTRVEIDSDANSAVVTWWETNQTDDTLVMKVSNDFGKTFVPLLKLAGNGTIAGGEIKPVL